MRILTVFSVALAAMMVFSACDNASDIKRPEHARISLADKLPLGGWTGRVLLQTVEPNQIAVAFANPELAPSKDGEYNDLFLMASEDPFPQAFNAEFTTAHLELTKSTLRVLNASGAEVFNYAVRMEDGESFADEVLVGYQLSRYPSEYSLTEEKTGERVSALRDLNRFARLISLRAEACENAGKTSMACTAGGPGSTSCSIGGCEVIDGQNEECSTTCGGGYYSCCRCDSLGAKCTCIASGS
jgi:hypothetical protein